MDTLIWPSKAGMNHSQSDTKIPPLRARAFVPGDGPACQAIFDSNVPEFFAPAEREAFASFLAALPGPYLVLEAEAGKVVACGGYAVAPGTATADLCWGMVLRAYHRTGLGRLLLLVRLERIRAEAAVHDVALNTSQHTRGFYERLGFLVERVQPSGYAPGLDRCDLRLRLAPPAHRPLCGSME
jgi:GNAT superfamily N-acetyltransferase